MILTVLLGAALCLAGSLLIGAGILRRVINREARLGWPDPAPVTTQNTLLLAAGAVVFALGLFFCAVPIGLLLVCAEW